MAGTFEANAQKRDYYLQIMQKAQQLNDQILIKLLLKKLAHLGMTNSVFTATGCNIIFFPPFITELRSKNMNELPGGYYLNSL